jgi:hypothetical protein
MGFIKVKIFPKPVLSSNGGVWQIKKSELFEDLLIYQNWDRRPIVKFDRQHDVMHIYQLILRIKRFYVEYGRQHSEKAPTKKATDWSGIKNGKPSKEIWLSWYQSLAKTHFWIYGKFENMLSIPLTRNMTFKKVRLFPRGDSRGDSPGDSPRRGNEQRQIGKTAFKIIFRWLVWGKDWPF